MLKHWNRAIYAKLWAPLRLGIAMGLLAIWTQGPAIAQTAWPQKPIRWIIPYTPGGLTDTVTRIVIQKVQHTASEGGIMQAFQIILRKKACAVS